MLFVHLKHQVQSDYNGGTDLTEIFQSEKLIIFRKNLKKLI